MVPSHQPPDFKQSTPHFKMEPIASLKDVIQKGDFMGKTSAHCKGASELSQVYLGRSALPV